MRPSSLLFDIGAFFRFFFLPTINSSKGIFLNETEKLRYFIRVIVFRRKKRLNRLDSETSNEIKLNVLTRLYKKLQRYRILRHTKV